MHKPEYHLFVCASLRPNGGQKGFCHSKEAVGLLERFMELLEEHDLQDCVMVTHTGCFGICTKGPVAVVYQQHAESVWYGGLEMDDLEPLVESHFIQGEPYAAKRID
jgi:(2Fe-2S) ferredoxin